MVDFSSAGSPERGVLSISGSGGPKIDHQGPPGDPGGPKIERTWSIRDPPDLQEVAGGLFEIQETTELKMTSLAEVAWIDSGALAGVSRSSGWLEGRQRAFRDRADRRKAAGGPFGIARIAGKVVGDLSGSSGLERCTRSRAGPRA
jgi:hypothetical protein